MKILILLTVALLMGCASADVEKSASRDRTMSDMAKTALINEMLKSSDPLVRAKGADAAAAFINSKTSIFPW